MKFVFCDCHTYFVHPDDCKTYYSAKKGSYLHFLVNNNEFYAYLSWPDAIIVMVNFVHLHLILLRQ
jgi:hypothetical protein